ncbi:MAG: hypothetical protein ACFFEY_18950 [Candidatus Thorarchaeota archaeon]
MQFPISRLNHYINSIDNIKGLVSVFGDFGVGKTTFSIQTAINSTKLGNTVVYIYTKPNIPSERIFMITNNSKEILEKIILIQVTDFNELVKIIFNFEFLILNYFTPKNIRCNLIILDSLTDLYRLELDKDKKEKNYTLNYQLNQILATLTYLNEIYNIETLVVNEVSRKKIDDQIIEKQSGGKVTEFWVNYTLRIIRTFKLNERKFIFTNISKNRSNEFTSYLTKKGFE